MAFKKYPQGTVLSDGTIADGNTEYNDAVVQSVVEVPEQPQAPAPTAPANPFSLDVGRGTPYTFTPDSFTGLKDQIRSGQLSIDQAASTLIANAYGENADALRISNPIDKIKGFLADGLGEVTQGGRVGQYDSTFKFMPTQTTVFSSINGVAQPTVNVDGSAPTSNGTLPGSAPVMPPPQPIGNPIPAPQIGGQTPAPNLPVPEAGTTSAINTQNLTSQIETAKAAVQAEADKRAEDYQKKIDDLTKQRDQFQALQDSALGSIDEATKKTLDDKMAALELEKQRFDENYNANQSLIGEMQNLLNTGNQLVEEMRGTTGLASIMNPRIAKTMSDVQARAGVIGAVISARNGQMTYAQQQLGTTYDALSSMLTDQVNYYKTVISFYDAQESETRGDILKLTNDQKDYLDVKLKLLDQDLQQLQATKEIISKAMLDPDTATQYAMAGVTMNDTPEQIAAKLATYGYSQELKNTSNAMGTNGYTSVPISGVTPITITDSRGNTKQWYKIPGEKQVQTSIITKDGRQVLINSQTGQVIQDLGASTSSGSAPGAGQTTLNPGDVRIDASGKTIASNPIAAVQEAVNNASAQGTPGTRTPSVQELLDAYKANGNKPLTDAQYKQLYGVPTTTSTASTEKVLTTVGFPSGTTQSDINEIETALRTGTYAGQKIANPMGSDGYIDPAGYVKLMNFWIQQGGTKQSFFDKYPYKKLINPANTWVWADLGIANPYVKASTSSSSSTSGRSS